MLDLSWEEAKQAQAGEEEEKGTIDDEPQD